MPGDIGAAVLLYQQTKHKTYPDDATKTAQSTNARLAEGEREEVRQPQVCRIEERAGDGERLANPAVPPEPRGRERLAP